MKRKAVTIVITLIVASMAGFAADAPRVFSLDPDAVSALRERIVKQHFNDPALEKLRADASRAMKLPLRSVTQKEGVPPSGDKHDYMSLAPYWWPNPKTPNGLPYIRRDGERNPEINKFEDHKYFGEVMSAVRTLGLAYYLFRDEGYAAKATDLLRTWFIDPKTRMSPNFNFAQAVRGVNDGRGTGLIESRGVASLVDGIGLLAGSHAWTAADQKAMQSWFASFLDWMLQSDNGKAEGRARNNHGSFYDVQIVSLALFTGDEGLAKRVLQEAREKRIASQIEPDGRQPLELARTKALSYSVFNLEALFQLATLGDRVGVDLWHYQAKNGASLRKALDYLAPFATGEQPWPYKQIEAINRIQIASLFLIAATEYSNPAYKELATKIDPQVVQQVEYVMHEGSIRKNATGGM